MIPDHNGKGRSDLPFPPTVAVSLASCQHRPWVFNQEGKMTYAEFVTFLNSPSGLAMCSIVGSVLGVLVATWTT